jgi:ABC-type Fe3+/spermidine/putrescine transport system ATPase subunit
LSAAAQAGPARTGAGSTILQVRNLTKNYGAMKAVDGISFDIERGEVLTLLGPSGCGKSTTLRIVAGLDEPDGGEISIGGRIVAATERGLFVPADKRNVGLVFQSYAIWPHMTVEENVAYPLKVRKKYDEKESKERVQAILEWVNLGGLGKRPATLLSGGQQQRVALARALVYEPDLLLLDEPLSNLDAKLRQQMRVEIRKLQQRLGISILFVTHDQVEAMALSQRIAVMNAGRIEQLGTPREIYEEPASHFVQSFVGSTVTVLGRVVEHASGRCVELPGAGRIRPTRAAMPAGGSEVRVAFRTECITVEADGREAGDNQLLGVVKTVSYMGDRHEYQLCAGNAEFSIEVPSRLAEEGETVLLRIDPAAVKVWPA